LRVEGLGLLFGRTLPGIYDCLPREREKENLPREREKERE